VIIDVSKIGTMKVYLINLDKDIERLSAAKAQFKRLGITYERISAVYGKDLNLTERDNAVNKFRWWCAVGRPVRIGEIGCALSHYSIYKQMRDVPFCILEDDVILDSRFMEVLDYIEDQIDLTKSQVFLLSNHSKDISVDNNIHIEPAKRDMYTEGYVITPKAAKALLKANLPLQCPCDWWGRWVKQGIIELYHAFPTVCSQDQSQYVSGTVDSRCFKVDDLGFMAYWFHKLKRLVGKVIDGALLNSRL
jgi:glycosyl transferase family 25